MKSPNLIQKARDLWNRKEDQRRVDADKEADPHRADEERRMQQRRQEERALEQFEKRASEYNAELDGEWEEILPAAPVARPITEAAPRTAEPTADLVHQYDMEPLIPLSDEEIAKLKVIEAEDPQGRSMHAQFDPRTVIALREQGEAAPVLNPHEPGQALTQRGLSTACNAGGRDAPRQDPDPEDDLEPDDELEM
jgi:hypothetical protein